MANKYLDTLSDTCKKRYLEKLTFGENLLPDPLDEDLRQFVFLKGSKLPPIQFGDLYVYLIDKECSYTKETLKNYKALDSYNYVLSGKVRDILSYENKSLQICVLTCEVQASQTVKKVHKPWIVANLTGTVHSGHCTCMAGLGEVCSHVAALLFAIEIANREGVQVPAPTALPCLWNRTSKKVNPLPAAKIQFSHKRKIDSIQDFRSELPSREGYQEFFKIVREDVPTAPLLTAIHCQGSSKNSLELLSVGALDDVIEKQTIDIKLREENVQVESLKYPDIFTTIRDIYEEVRNVPDTQFCEVIIKRLHFPIEMIKNIEVNTREQSKSPDWMCQRQGRLTASIFGRVLRCTTGGENIALKIMGQSKPYEGIPIQWGRINEANAREKFELQFKSNHRNGQVQHTGFLIDEEFGFLGATPDGVTRCDCCERFLLEIKCPYRGKGILIQDINPKGFFLDENLTLKMNDPYYDQIQGQMAIWQLKNCYFVTYTDKDMLVQVVEFNEEYWKLRKPKLVSFYKEHVLPKILSNI